MSTTSPERLRAVVNATIQIYLASADAIELAGPQGLPSGHLYAHLMATGIGLPAYERMIDTLVDAGRIVRRGDLLVSARAAS